MPTALADLLHTVVSATGRRETCTVRGALDHPTLSPTNHSNHIHLAGLSDTAPALLTHGPRSSAFLKHRRHTDRGLGAKARMVSENPGHEVPQTFSFPSSSG